MQPEGAQRETAMPGKEGQLNRKTAQAAPSGALKPAVLAVAVVAVAFATLMVRLQVTRGGYAASQTKAQVMELRQENRRLRLEVARLTSHARLRRLAGRFGLGPARAGQLVVVP